MAIIDFKATKCKHCYKCVRNCEVKAIMIKDERAEIMPDKCILCGKCMQVCPQSAKTLVSDLNTVKGYIANHIPTVVSIAPSYMGLLKYKTIGQINAALRKLGFADVRETSEGAAMVTAEYARLLEEGEMETIITTCCPSVNDLIEIYYPQLVPYMAPVVSPMIAHGKMLKEELGSNVKVVFLGPCIAKKKEAGDVRHDSCIDAVLNFNDINRWLNEEEITIEDCEDIPFRHLDPKVNRLYPVTNGVVNSVLATEEKKDGYRKFYVHGAKNCIDLCESMVRGEIKGCFIEMNMCSGGCIKGPTVEDESISRFKVKLDMEETIEKDIEYGPRNLGISEEEISKRVKKSMEMVGLDYETYKDKSPFDLSGGQKRRVAIAGVIAMEPKVLILDEPTAGLDPKGREDILAQIRLLHKEYGMTIIMVSHSMEDVAKIADRVIVMNSGEIVLDGKIAEVFKEVETLEKIGLAVPQVTYLIRELRNKGFNISEEIFTISQAKEALLEIIRNNN